MYYLNCYSYSYNTAIRKTRRKYITLVIANYLAFFILITLYHSELVYD